MIGLTLIVLLVNICVAIRAECCKCDCQHNGAGQYYHPAAVYHVPVAYAVPQPHSHLAPLYAHQTAVSNHYQADHAEGHHSSESEDHDHHHHKDKDIHYKFAYAVNDAKTHDVKKHEEERQGDVVKGEYSLLEGDGNVRTVKYYADWKTGFHAQVLNSRNHQHQA